MAAVAKKRKADTKPICKYGNKCYRRNPQHIQNYRHPGRDDDVPNDEDEAQRDEKKEGKKGEKTKISDYFGAGSKTHDVSDSDEENDNDHEPPKKKRSIDKEPPKKEKTLDKGNSSSTAEKEEQKDSDKKEESDEEKASADNEEDAEVESPPPSPEDVRENIKSKFLMEMPEDFYHLWKFCKSLNPSAPKAALEKTLNLTLVGPYDILAERHKNVKKNRHGRRPNYLLHYRYFYDPPEFQTIVAATKNSSFHFGYYRDDPKEAPVFVASNSPDSPPREKIHPSGDNIFAAVHIYASDKMKSHTGEKRKSLEELIKSLEDTAKKHDLSLAATTKGMKERKKKVVCPTFHGAGIVVPVDDNEVGYRPVPETPESLKVTLKMICESPSQAKRDENFESLQELITFVQFANDECDYGEGLELGLDLFSFGHKTLHPQIVALLPLAYQLLNRPEFSDIIEAHLKRRRPVTESVDELAV